MSHKIGQDILRIDSLIAFINSLKYSIAPLQVFIKLHNSSHISTPETIIRCTPDCHQSVLRWKPILVSFLD